MDERLLAYIAVMLLCANFIVVIIALFKFARRRPPEHWAQKWRDDSKPKPEADDQEEAVPIDVKKVMKTANAFSGFFSFLSLLVTLTLFVFVYFLFSEAASALDPGDSMLAVIVLLIALAVIYILYGIVLDHFYHHNWVIAYFQNKRRTWWIIAYCAIHLIITRKQMSFYIALLFVSVINIIVVSILEKRRTR